MPRWRITMGLMESLMNASLWRFGAYSRGRPSHAKPKMGYAVKNPRKLAAMAVVGGDGRGGDGHDSRRDYCPRGILVTAHKRPAAQTA